MALELLKCNPSSQFKHLPKHDLKSFFYVLLTICIYVDSPGYLRSPIPEIHELSVCLNDWWATYDRHAIARQKGIQLFSFDKYVLQRLLPYWNDFHPVLKELHAAFWDSDTAIMQPNTHQKFLNVLV